MLRTWLGLSVLALVLVVVGCGGSESAVAITGGDQIAGRYRAVGTNPDNRTSYSGEVVVSSQVDGTVAVSWAIGNDRWTGCGTITEEGELFVTYTGTFAGTGTWVLRSDGNLDGIWRQNGFSASGTEDWFSNWIFSARTRRQQRF